MRESTEVYSLVLVLVTVLFLWLHDHSGTAIIMMSVLSIYDTVIKIKLMQFIRFFISSTYNAEDKL